MGASGHTGWNAQSHAVAGLSNCRVTNGIATSHSVCIQFNHCIHPRTAACRLVQVGEHLQVAGLSHRAIDGIGIGELDDGGGWYAKRVGPAGKSERVLDGLKLRVAEVQIFRLMVYMVSPFSTLDWLVRPAVRAIASPVPVERHRGRGHAAATR